MHGRPNKILGRPPQVYTKGFSAEKVIPLARGGQGLRVAVRRGRGRYKWQKKGYVAVFLLRCVYALDYTRFCTHTHTRANLQTPSPKINKRPTPPLRLFRGSAAASGSSPAKGPKRRRERAENFAPRGVSSDIASAANLFAVPSRFPRRTRRVPDERAHAQFDRSPRNASDRPRTNRAERHAFRPIRGVSKFREIRTGFR